MTTAHDRLASLLESEEIYRAHVNAEKIIRAALAEYEAEHRRFEEAAGLSHEWRNQAERLRDALSSMVNAERLARSEVGGGMVLRIAAKAAADLLAMPRGEPLAHPSRGVWGTMPGPKSGGDGEAK